MKIESFTCRYPQMTAQEYQLVESCWEARQIEVDKLNSKIHEQWSIITALEFKIEELENERREH